MAQGEGFGDLMAFPEKVTVVPAELVKKIRYEISIMEQLAPIDAKGSTWKGRRYPMSLTQREWEVLAALLPPEEALTKDPI